MSVTEKLLLPLLAEDPTKPLITHYDDAAGTRVELSRATVANWAAKTANWLCDELDAEPGHRALIRLPAHWQTLGVLLGAWWCGMQVTDDPDGAEVAFVGPSGDGGDAQVVAIVALDALGMGLPDDPPADTVDYLTEIRLHGDHFAPLGPIPSDTPALHGQTVEHLVAEAHTRARRLGSDARVLSTLDWDTPEALLDGVLSVLAASGSLVQCSPAAAETLDARAEMEHVTVRL